MYKTRFKLKVYIIVDVYAQWLISMLGAASSLSVCCRATTMVLRRASFRNLRKVFFYFEIQLHLTLVSIMGYWHKSSRKLKRNQPHKRSKTMQIVRKSYGRKLKLPKHPRKQRNLASKRWG
jgi:hypothetical protein